MNKLRHMEMLRAKHFVALKKFTFPSRLKSIKTCASFHFYRPQGKVMFLHLSVCSQRGEGARQRPPYKKKNPNRDPPEGTWDQTGSDIIHPHLVTATAAVGTHSC